MSRSLQKALLTWLNEDNAPEINAEYAPEFYIAEMDAATEAIMREAVCSERKLRKKGSRWHCSSSPAAAYERS